MFDHILRNGLVFDGSGGPPLRADVGMTAGRITVVGAIGDAAGVVIDCSGQMVAPGFIDLHTHSDATLMVDADAYSSLMQGVTTEIAGNCGFSCAPCHDRELVQQFMLGRERGQQFTWTHFGEYLDALEASRPGVNVAAYVGHNTVRLNVLGTAGRAADEQEGAYIGTLVGRALDEGAIGVSTGLEYNPGFNADLTELVGLARIAAEYDVTYATHIRNRDWNYEAGIGEALATARLSGARLQLSHLAPKVGAPEGAAEHMLEMMAWTRSLGVDVGFDVIPHEWGPTFVMTVLPRWAYEGGVTAILQRLRDPALRRRLKNNPAPQWKIVAERNWRDLVLTQSSANAGLIGLDFEQIGQRRGQDPHDAILDVLLEEGEKLTELLWVGRISREADIRQLMRDGRCGVISDTMALNLTGPLAHRRFTPTGFGWTARFLGHYCRDERLLDLGEGIRRITQWPAQRMKLRQRGELRPGFHADVVVFDPEALTDLSTVQRMNVSPAGIAQVFVNGRRAVADGARTSERAGMVLRRAAST